MATTPEVQQKGYCKDEKYCKAVWDNNQQYFQSLQTEVSQLEPEVEYYKTLFESLNTLKTLIDAREEILRPLTHISKTIRTEALLHAFKDMLQNSIYKNEQVILNAINKATSENLQDNITDVINHIKLQKGKRVARRRLLAQLRLLQKSAAADFTPPKHKLDMVQANQCGEEMHHNEAPDSSREDSRSGISSLVINELTNSSPRSSDTSSGVALVDFNALVLGSHWVGGVFHLLDPYVTVTDQVCAIIGVDINADHTPKTKRAKGRRIRRELDILNRFMTSESLVESIKNQLKITSTISADHKNYQLLVQMACALGQRFTRAFFSSTRESIKETLQEISYYLQGKSQNTSLDQLLSALSGKEGFRARSVRRITKQYKKKLVDQTTDQEGKTPFLTGAIQESENGSLAGELRENQKQQQKPIDTIKEKIKERPKQLEQFQRVVPELDKVLRLFKDEALVDTQQFNETFTQYKHTFDALNTELDEANAKVETFKSENARLLDLAKQYLVDQYGCEQERNKFFQSRFNNLAAEWPELLKEQLASADTLSLSELQTRLSRLYFGMALETRDKRITVTHHLKAQERRYKILKDIGLYLIEALLFTASEQDARFVNLRHAFVQWIQVMNALKITACCGLNGDFAVREEDALYDEMNVLLTACNTVSKNDNRWEELQQYVKDHNVLIDPRVAGDLDFEVYTRPHFGWGSGEMIQHIQILHDKVDAYINQDIATSRLSSEHSRYLTQHIYLIMSFLENSNEGAEEQQANLIKIRELVITTSTNLKKVGFVLVPRSVGAGTEAEQKLLNCNLGPGVSIDLWSHLSQKASEIIDNKPLFVRSFVVARETLLSHLVSLNSWMPGFQGPITQTVREMQLLVSSDQFNVYTISPEYFNYSYDQLLNLKFITAQYAKLQHLKNPATIWKYICAYLLPRMEMTAFQTPGANEWFPCYVKQLLEHVKLKVKVNDLCGFSDRKIFNEFCNRICAKLGPLTQIRKSLMLFSQHVQVLAEREKVLWPSDLLHDAQVLCKYEKFDQNNSGLSQSLISRISTGWIVTDDADCVVNSDQNRGFRLADVGLVAQFMKIRQPEISHQTCIKFAVLWLIAHFDYSDLNIKLVLQWLEQLQKISVAFGSSSPVFISTVSSAKGDLQTVFSDFDNNLKRADERRVARRQRQSLGSVQDPWSRRLDGASAVSSSFAGSSYADDASQSVAASSARAERSDSTDSSGASPASGQPEATIPRKPTLAEVLKRFQSTDSPLLSQTVLGVQAELTDTPDIASGSSSSSASPLEPGVLDSSTAAPQAAGDRRDSTVTGFSVPPQPQEEENDSSSLENEVLEPIKGFQNRVLSYIRMMSRGSTGFKKNMLQGRDKTAYEFRRDLYALFSEDSIPGRENLIGQVTQALVLEIPTELDAKYKWSTIFKVGFKLFLCRSYLDNPDDFSSNYSYQKSEIAQYFKDCVEQIRTDCDLLQNKLVELDFSDRHEIISRIRLAVLSISKNMIAGFKYNFKENGTVQDWANLLQACLPTLKTLFSRLCKLSDAQVKYDKDYVLSIRKHIIYFLLSCFVEHHNFIISSRDNDPKALEPLENIFGAILAELALPETKIDKSIALEYFVTIEVSLWKHFEDNRDNEFIQCFSVLNQLTSKIQQANLVDADVQQRWEAMAQHVIKHAQDENSRKDLLIQIDYFLKNVCGVNYFSVQAAGKMLDDIIRGVPEIKRGNLTSLFRCKSFEDFKDFLGARSGRVLMRTISSNRGMSMSLGQLDLSGCFDNDIDTRNQKELPVDLVLLVHWLKNQLDQVIQGQIIPVGFLTTLASVIPYCRDKKAEAYMGLVEGITKLFGMHFINFNDVSSLPQNIVLIDVPQRSLSSSKTPLSSFTPLFFNDSSAASPAAVSAAESPAARGTPESRGSR